MFEQLFNGYAPSWLIPILIATGTGLGLTILGKLMPREKLAGIVSKFFEGIAVTLDTVLLRWLGNKPAEQVEEGVFCTLAYALRKGLEAFETKLLSNNTKRTPQK